MTRDAAPANSDPRRSVGRRGEDLALAHFRALGYELIARNHRTRHGEIDLIVFGEGALVFVEVKTRRARPGAGGEPWLAPLEGTRAAQRRRLRRLAMSWLSEAADRPRADALRLDAVGVVLDRRGELLSLDHLVDAM